MVVVEGEQPVFWELKGVDLETAVSFAAFCKAQRVSVSELFVDQNSDGIAESLQPSWSSCLDAIQAATAQQLFGMSFSLMPKRWSASAFSRSASLVGDAGLQRKFKLLETTLLSVIELMNLQLEEEQSARALGNKNDKAFVPLHSASLPHPTPSMISSRQVTSYLIPVSCCSSISTDFIDIVHYVCIHDLIMHFDNYDTACRQFSFEAPARFACNEACRLFDSASR